MKAIVDTELWSLAKKKPIREKFGSKEEFEKALNFHLKARDFFLNEFPKINVYMSLHQLAEIFHVLTFRGHRIPVDEASAIVLGIIEDPRIAKISVSSKHIHEAIKESARTGIHIWDFLCFVPVRDFVDTVCTTDKHFEVIGKYYGISIVNPIGSWLEL